jgi:ABC-2 type transport system permease protein
MRERLKQMLIKEFRQIFRDPRMRTLILLAPVLQMMLFGYAVSTDVKETPTAILDLDHTAGSRELASRFLSSGHFTLVAMLDDEAEVARLMDSGDALVVLRMNRGFQGDLESGRTAQIQMLLDGSDSSTAGVVLSFANTIVRQFSQDQLTQRMRRETGVRVPAYPVRLESRSWFNENRESRNYYVPAVIAMIVSVITLMLTGMAVVREREIGTMEQLMVSPIRPAEFILGKTLPFAVISLFDVLLITCAGVFWFEVPIRGSLLLLLFCTCLYLLASLSAGLLISTISQTMQQAMMSMLLFYFPVMLLSGMVFPIANMPVVIQWLTLANPLRHFLVIIRGIFLKGIGINVLWPQMLALLILGCGMLFLASRRFHKTLA